MDVFKTIMCLEKFIIINFFWEKQKQKNLFGKKASKKNLLVHNQQ